MSRTGDCWDNAVAESFFATLKAEHVDHEDFPTRAAGRRLPSPTYIDGFYNVQRLHSHRLHEPDRVRIEIVSEPGSSVIRLSTEAGEAQITSKPPSTRNT